MDINSIENERISDYGCRKVLGIRNVNSYINGYKYNKPDSYISQRKSSKKSDISPVLWGGAIAAGLLALISIIKKKKVPTTATESVKAAKTSIVSKAKNLFNKAKSKIKSS